MKFIAKNILYILSFMLLPFWIIAVAVFSIGGMVHLLPMFSALFFTLGQIKNS
jgi:hypothetical protein